MKALVLRVQFLDEQDTDLTRQIDALAAETNPVLPSKDFARSIIGGCMLDH